jgi:phosphoesterase RecJ-like protein
MTDIFKRVVSEIEDADSIVITSHKGPDGDSIGCSLGLFHFIEKLGKRVSICHPDAAPYFLTWLNGSSQIVDFEHNSSLVANLISNADLIFCLDYNSADRVGTEMKNLILDATAKKVMIDHHPYPEDFCDLVISDMDCCSTSQLIFELIDQSVNVNMLDENIATPLYLGIMTDTGSFRFPSVTSRTHEVIAELIRRGVNHSMVHEKVYDSNTLDRLQLRGYAVAEKFQKLGDYPVAMISLTTEELERFHYKKGDTEGLVNVALSVEGVKVAAFFMERDGEVKISFRSKGSFFVNELAKHHFSGGGHKYAAGGVSSDSMEITLARFRDLVPNYFS